MIADQIRDELKILRRGRQLYLIYDPSTDGEHVASLTSYYGNIRAAK